MTLWQRAARLQPSGENVIPPLDGPFRQNDDLERAWPMLERLPGLDDVAVAGDGTVYVSAGKRVLRLTPGAQTPEPFAAFEGAVGALTLLPGGEIAVAVDGHGVAIVGEGPLRWIATAEGTAITGATALVESGNTLFIAEGAMGRCAADWTRDLMEKGVSGRVIRADLATGATSVLASGLRWPAGLAVNVETLVISEAWAHRLLSLPLTGGLMTPATSNLPGYPGRLSPTAAGGFWLTITALRTQLVDFVLAEDAYRCAMLAEVPPDLWVAPSLTSSAHDPHPWKSPHFATDRSYGEPLHAGRIRSFGEIRPWAPARSYGLVVRLDAELDPLASLHARTGSLRHGITGAAEQDGRLLIACKGYGTLLGYATDPGQERASERVAKRKTTRERIRSYLARQGMDAAVGQEVLRAEAVSKSYGGIAAIQDISFDLRAGEVHAILGENGAGKSTLCKVVAGAVAPTSGRLVIGGVERRLRSPADGLNAGVAMVYQETSLVPGMTVAQNICLGREDWLTGTRTLNTRMQAFLASINFGGIDAAAVVAGLGQGQKQLVEIARAIWFEARVIIFDEPTAALTPAETQRFFELVETLKRRGLGLIFISHNLEEVTDLADRITIMRDGRHVVTGPVGEFSRDRIVRNMVGRDGAGGHYTQLGRRQSRSTEKRRKVLTVEDVRAAPLVKNMNFALYENEITGVAGLVGSGRSEIARVIAGALRRDLIGGGRITLDGRPVRYREPGQAIRDGIVYVTEDRKVDGFFETMGIAENIYLGALAASRSANPFVSAADQRRVGQSWVDRLNIRAIDLSLRVNRLSGGNQQKVVVAKSLVQEPRVIIIDEPTRGVDVGAIAEMHSAIRALKGPGRAVLVISSYLPEVLTLCDRVLVARRGRIAAEFAVAEATEEKLMQAAIG